MQDTFLWSLPWLSPAQHIAKQKIICCVIFVKFIRVLNLVALWLRLFFQHLPWYWTSHTTDRLLEYSAGNYIEIVPDRTQLWRDTGLLSGPILPSRLVQLFRADHRNFIPSPNWCLDSFYLTISWYIPPRSPIISVLHVWIVDMSSIYTFTSFNYAQICHIQLE